MCVYRQHMLMIREVYQASMDGDDLDSSANLSLALSSGDPFYDRAPWFKLIGR